MSNGLDDVFECFLVESCLQGQRRLYLVCDQSSQGEDNL